MAKEKIKITQQILKDIVEKNPNKTYTQIVEILNKGTPFIKYVTPINEKFNNTKLAYYTKKFKLEGKILKGNINRTTLNQLDPDQAENVKGFLEELVKSDGKVKTAGISKGANFFKYVDDTLKKAAEEI